MTELLVTEEASISLPSLKLSDDQFFEFCVRNGNYRIERTAQGRIVIMPNTGLKTGNRNIELAMQLQAWTKKDRRGIASDSSTLFLLPDTAMRSPDASWLHRSRVVGLDERQKEKYCPCCPDFVIELTSPTDRLPAVQKKMAEWMANGCQLGWILDARRNKIHIYRASGVEVLSDITEIRGEGPVEGFVLDLSGIWNPDW